jgi:UPF0755 protein
VRKTLDVLIWLFTTLFIFALIPLVLVIVFVEFFMASRLPTRIAILLIILLFALATVAHWFYYRQIGDPQKEYIVLVRPGDTAKTLYARLTETGMPINRQLYSLLMSRTKTDRQIKPGRYRLKGGLTHYQLVMSFQKKGELNKVTIPEGLTIRAIVPILAKEIPTDSLKLAQLLSDATFFKSFHIEASGFEGYLFPETYSFFPYDEPQQVIAELVNTFRSRITPEMLRRASELNMSLNKVITLASLIESETAEGKERGLISSVFHNRLRLGWRLQCDPTVIYALGGLSRPLTHNDLEFDSPYNTYVYYGLPPGPICSPGLASINAAIHPAQTNYTYFVATGTGQHIFTANLNDHNRAVSDLRRKAGTARAKQ